MGGCDAIYETDPHVGGFSRFCTICLDAAHGMHHVAEVCSIYHWQHVQPAANGASTTTCTAKSPLKFYRLL